MTKLHISKSLSLPIDAVTQKFGILGRTGSGKSYFATKLCEEMLDAKAQIVALDVIIDRRGEDVTAEEIGQEVGIDHTGGHFSNTIGPLGTLGLIRRSHGVISPTEIIFPPGLS